MAEKEKKSFGGLKLASQTGLASIDMEALTYKSQLHISSQIYVH